MPAWYVAPCLEQLRAELNTRWPGRDRTSDGGIGNADHAARASDHNPDWSSGGVVRARDFDEDGIPTAVLLREAITDPRTNYVIYERQLWQRVRGFKPVEYTGINPHDHHMHVSIRHGKQWENDRSPWFTDAVLTSHTTPIPGVDIPKRVSPPVAALDPITQELLMAGKAAAVLKVQQGGQHYLCDLREWAVQALDTERAELIAARLDIDIETLNGRDVTLTIDTINGQREANGRPPAGVQSGV